MTISADEQVCKYYFLALQSNALNRLNIQRFPFNPINSTQSTCDLMPPGALWMKVDENIRGTTCISDAVFDALQQIQRLGRDFVSWQALQVLMQESAKI